MWKGMWIVQTISYTGTPTPESHRPKLGLRSTSLNTIIYVTTKVKCHHITIMIQHSKEKQRSHATLPMRSKTNRSYEHRSQWSTNNTLAPNLRSRKNVTAGSQIIYLRRILRLQNGIKHDMSSWQEQEISQVDSHAFNYIPYIRSGKTPLFKAKIRLWAVSLLLENPCGRTQRRKQNNIERASVTGEAASSAVFARLPTPALLVARK